MTLWSPMTLHAASYLYIFSTKTLFSELTFTLLVIIVNLISFDVISTHTYLIPPTFEDI